MWRHLQIHSTIHRTAVWPTPCYIQCCIIMCLHHIQLTRSSRTKVRANAKYPSISEETMSQVEKFINHKLKEQKDGIMPTLHDWASYPITPKMILIIVSYDMIDREIPNYVGQGDLIQRIQKHDSSLLERTSDDNLFALLFPTTISKASVSSWADLNGMLIH